MGHWSNSEERVLAKLVEDRRSLANALHFALSSAFPDPGSAFGQDLYIARNVPRAMLGLAPDAKPGDIDLLLVPFRGSTVLRDRTIAIEVKVVRPSFENPDRNANSLGRSQVEGLLEAGFPFVGLLHISIPGALPEELHWTVPWLDSTAAQAGNMAESARKFTFDPFSLFAADRQKGRMKALSLPQEVCFHSIAFNLSRDRERFAGNTIGNESRGLKNPRESERLQQAIAALLETAPWMFKRMEWYAGDR